MSRLHLALVIIAAVALMSASSAAQEKPDPAALTAEQRKVFQAAETAAQAKAASVALKIAGLAKEIDENILAEKPDPEREHKLVDEVGQVIAEAIRLRIAVAREMLNVLTPEQKGLVVAELRKPGANADMVELMKPAFAEKR